MQEIQLIHVDEENDFYHFINHKTCEQLEIMFPNGYDEFWFTLDRYGIIVENTMDDKYNGEYYIEKIQ